MNRILALLTGFLTRGGRGARRVNGAVVPLDDLLTSRRGDGLDDHFRTAQAVACGAGRPSAADAPTGLMPVVPAPISLAPPAVDEPGVNVELLRRVLEHITAHPEQWDQRAWWHFGVPESPCGTAGCLAGWAVHFGAGPGEEIVSPDNDDYGEVVRDSDGMFLGSVERVARVRLGLSDHQAVELFDPRNKLRGLWGLAGRYTGGQIVAPAVLPDGS